jgi:hypothetical protein
MALDLTIVFVCEGTSDKPLLGVLRSLVLNVGANRVAGEAVALTGTVHSKIEHVLAMISKTRTPAQRSGTA